MRGGNTLPWAGPTVWLMVAPGQLSVTVGAVQLTAAPHTPASIATGPMLAGQLAITGGCVSGLTVTVKLHVAVIFFLMMRRPPSSTLFPCTTLFRSGPPVWLMVAPGQLSVTVGAVQLTAAPHTPASIATGPIHAWQLAITVARMPSSACNTKKHVAVNTPPSGAA